MLVDATICKTQADATSQRGGLEAAGIGRSKGGLTPKIHAAIDALGMPVRTTITPGQWADSPKARGLIEGLRGVTHVICDAACDADHLRSFITQNLGATAQIKPDPSRTIQPEPDWSVYKKRHLVERFFNKMKRSRRIFLRCEKTDSSYKAFVKIACAMTWIT